MKMTTVHCPRVLPEFVACYAVRLAQADHRLHFAAGRACASKAIGVLTGEDAVYEVLRGPAGEPLWPSGLTGSITHTGDFVSAAVARSTAARGIGLDAEHIVTGDRAARVGSMIGDAVELALGGPEVPPAVRVTLLFSVKEAAFKCLYPTVQQRFYYQALRVTHLELDTGIFRAALATPLPGFRQGHPLSGRFALDESLVLAGLCLPA